MPETTSRRVKIVLVYRESHTSRTGRTTPVGRHVRAELRDAGDNSVIRTHAYSPFSVQRLRWDAQKAGYRFTAAEWYVEQKEADHA